MAARKTALNQGYGWYLVPGIIIFAVIVFVPFLSNIGVSFTVFNGIGVPKWIGLVRTMKKAISDPTFWASFRNNLSLIVAMTVIPTAIGLFLASFLFDWVAPRLGNGAATFYHAGYYVPQVIPVVVAAVVWRWMYQRNWGVINYLLGLVGLEQWQQNWLGDKLTAMPSVMAVIVRLPVGLSACHLHGRATAYRP